MQRTYLGLARAEAAAANAKAKQNVARIRHVEAAPVLPQHDVLLVHERRHHLGVRLDVHVAAAKADGQL